MPGTTPTFAIPYPLGSESPNGPAQMQALAQAVEDTVEVHGPRVQSYAHSAANNVGTTGVTVLDQTITNPFAVPALMVATSRASASVSVSGARPAMIAAIQDVGGTDLRRDEMGPTVTAASGVASLFTECDLILDPGQTRRFRVVIVNRVGTGLVTTAVGTVAVGAQNINYSVIKLFPGAAVL